MHQGWNNTKENKTNQLSALILVGESINKYRMPMQKTRIYWEWFEEWQNDLHGWKPLESMGEGIWFMCEKGSLWSVDGNWVGEEQEWKLLSKSELLGDYCSSIWILGFLFLWNMPLEIWCGLHWIYRWIWVVWIL